MVISKRQIALFSSAILIVFLMSIVSIPALVGYFENKNIISNNPSSNIATFTKDVSDSISNQSIETDIKVDSNFQNSQEVANNNNLRVADFPLGWFASLKATQTPKKVADEGMNIVIPYVQEYDDANIMNFLDAAESSAVKVVLEIRRSAVRAGDIEAVKHFVSKFKQYPAVFAWYLYDEPELAKLSPGMLKQFYTAIKIEDSNKPITMSFALQGRLHNIRQYREAADILMFNVYPCRVGSPEFASFSGRRFYRYLNKKAARYSANKEGFWPVLQGYGEKADGTSQFGRRLPTMAEERYMFYSSVLAGADGLFFWAHYRSQQSWIDSVLTPIIKEFSSYNSAILEGKLEDRVNVERSDVQAVLYQNPLTKGYLLVAINHGDKEINTTVKLDKKTRAYFARVQEENRYVRLRNNNGGITFRDKFTPYAVHIYNIR